MNKIREIRVKLLNFERVKLLGFERVGVRKGRDKRDGIEKREKMEEIEAMGREEKEMR